MVELVIILPIFVLLIFGMMEATRLCMVAQLLTNAAREGCRVAITRGKTNADVTTRINATLTASGIAPGKVTTSFAITPSRANFQSSKKGDKLTVSLTVTFGNVNWSPAPFFYSSSTPISAGATMSSDRS